MAAPEVVAVTSAYLELLKGVPAAVVTAMVTYALGKIALRIQKNQFEVQKNQLEVAKAKLNLDLFEKRYELFESTWAALSRGLMHEVSMQDRQAFAAQIPKIGFLFGLDIKRYAQEILDRSNEIASLTRTLDQIEEARPEKERRIMASTEWFQTEARTGCKEKFDAYLSFSAWRSKD